VISADQNARRGQTAPDQECPASLPDLSPVTWRKSSWSGHNGNCVEVAELPHGSYGVRDSKDLAQPFLVFSRQEWGWFMTGIRAGKYDVS
jgi:hypothetical protein